MFVLGTAGHIDHGKSTLVQALTGMDPDRLREEKERGMTIDLGFAWFTLPSGREVGVVDVPGHERFIKNMLAGVGSIDLAMLVVAANESVMPQTREHLAILDLLGISKGVVAITKKDLVDNEWLDLVRMEIDELLRTTCLADSPVVAVSAVTGDGIKELAATIDRLLDETNPRQDTGNPRLPVDRVFTIAGAGTVVTGTLIDGSLSVGQEVEIVPSGLTSRIRGLQTHRSRVEKAAPGSRVAINLVGVATTDIIRGYVVTRPGGLKASKLLGVQLKLLPYLARPLPHGASVSFHTGAAETMARVRLLEKEKLGPGETSWAQLELAEPVAVLRGDHFIIRSPVETLGGGKVVDLPVRRLRRFNKGVIESLKVKEGGKAEEIILGRLEEKQPVEFAELQANCEVPSGEVGPAVEELVRAGRVIEIGEGDHALLFSAAGWKRMGEQATSILQEYHRRFPLRAGMTKVELASRLKLGKASPDIWSRLAAAGVIAEDGLTVRLPSRQAALSPAQKAQVDTFLRALDKEPYAPVVDVMPDAELLNFLVEQRRVVKVSDTVVFSTAAYNAMVEKLTAYLREKGKVTLAEVRDLFHTSRKYAQAFLEHLDEKKVTRRVGDERVLYQGERKP